MTTVAQREQKINPHAQPFTLFIPQAGDALTVKPTPTAATRSPERRAELATGKLMQYHFARHESRRAFEVREGGNAPKYILETITVNGLEVPHTCECPSFRGSPVLSKFCSHTDALYWLLEQAKEGEIVKSSAPAPRTPCSDIRCFSPCIMVRLYVEGRGEFTRQVCSMSVKGSCEWGKVA